MKPTTTEIRRNEDSTVDEIVTDVGGYGLHVERMDDAAWFVWFGEIKRGGETLVHGFVGAKCGLVTIECRIVLHECGEGVTVIDRNHADSSTGRDAEIASVWVLRHGAYLSLSPGPGVGSLMLLGNGVVAHFIPHRPAWWRRLFRGEPPRIECVVEEERP